MNNRPIGILDSGVGGLTIMHAIIQELPLESIIYIGDSYNTPFGAKSEEEIFSLAKKMIDFLLKKEVKMIVIACNTITVTCLDRLRESYPQIPLVGTVPVIKTAAIVTRNRRIGVLSTTRTAQSEYQKHLIDLFAGGCTVFNHGTDALVPLIEKGELENEEIKKVLKNDLAEFRKEKIDTLALGCTHFPFLREQMQEIVGKDVTVLDSGGAIARQVRRVLQQNGTLSDKQEGTITIFTTGNIHVIKKLLDSTINKRPIAVEKTTL